MELICLGSSSRGNCYLLRASGGETLAVECGVAMRDIKKACGWTLRHLAGCLVSHEHKDHAKSLVEMLRSGVRVLALPEVFASQGVGASPFAVAAVPLRGYRAGGFRAVAIPVEHDVPCLGYVIEHEEMGKTLFVTDTMMLEYRIPGLSHIMIEANYSDAILRANIDSGAVAPGLRDRLMRSHMELRTTAEVIRQTDLTEVSDIVLLHLSAGNADPGEFRREIERVSGKPVHIARPGLTIDFSKEPY